MLPDEVLLEVFDFWTRTDWDLDWDHIEEWHTVVHVCQRWRQIAFASPSRLDLQLLCKPGTPVRKYLGIWPPLPVSIDYHVERSTIAPDDEDNIVAALEHPHRVLVVKLDLTGSLWEKMAAAIQEPFPVLTFLNLYSEDRNIPIFPTKFLGGLAPRLQEIHFHGIPFPALPTLLLSTGDLRWLDLNEIPPTGYISPEVMVACLAALSRLDYFCLGFRLVTSRPNQIRPSPITRTVLPTLTSFKFKGASEYLEDLVAQIKSPKLDWFSINYFNQFIDFQVGQLSKFISSSLGRELTLFKHASIVFSRTEISFYIHSQVHDTRRPFSKSCNILCEGIDWQVSHMAQVLSHFSATLSHVTHLKLELELQKGRQLLEGADDAEWQLLLHRFSAVQTLHVSQNLAGYIARTLEDMPAGRMFTDALPSLDLLYLEGQPESSVEEFVTARQLSDRPVTIVETKTEFYRHLGRIIDGLA